MSAKTLATRRSDQQSTRRPGSAAHAPSLLATVDDVGNQSLQNKLISTNCTNQKVVPVVPAVLLVLLVLRVPVVRLVRLALVVLLVLLALLANKIRT